ncbi:MAG: hypothetical protein OHK0024_15690 [Thalassobaculales bacterium]
MRAPVIALAALVALPAAMSLPGRAAAAEPQVILAQAVQLPPLPALPKPPGGSSFDRLLAIGADQAVYLGVGIIGGAVIGNVLLAGSASTLVGAVAGGLLGHWYYYQDPTLVERLKALD